MPRVTRTVSVAAVALALIGCGGGDVAPEVPEGWSTHHSPDLDYSIAHPADWTVTFDPSISADVLVGTGDEEIQVGAGVVEKGWAADRIFLGGSVDARDRFGVEPDHVNDFAMTDGTRVRIFANQYTDGRGPFLFQRAVAVQGQTVWYVDWYSAVGDEGGDRQDFLQFMRSFQPGSGLPPGEDA
jgi:hypothetical protein